MKKDKEIKTIVFIVNILYLTMSLYVILTLIYHYSGVMAKFDIVIILLIGIYNMINSLNRLTKF